MNDTQSLYATTPQISSRSPISPDHISDRRSISRDVVSLQTSTHRLSPKKTFLLPPPLLPTASYNRSLNRMPFATAGRRRALQEDVCGGSITLPGRRMSLITARGTRTVRRLGLSELPVLSRCMAVRARAGKSAIGEMSEGKHTAGPSWARDDGIEIAACRSLNLRRVRARKTECCKPDH